MLRKTAHKITTSLSKNYWEQIFVEVSFQFIHLSASADVILSHFSQPVVLEIQLVEIDDDFSTVQDPFGDLRTKLLLGMYFVPY